MYSPAEVAYSPKEKWGAEMLMEERIKKEVKNR